MIDTQKSANQEIVVRSAFQFLAFRLKQFDLMAQSEAMTKLANNPDIREDAAHAILELPNPSKS